MTAHQACHVHAAPANWADAASATLHCLSGCAIGEFIGLAIGVHYGLEPALTTTQRGSRIQNRG